MAKRVSEYDQFQVRLPEGMRDRLRDAASDNNRSMNAEIVDRLESSLSTFPRVSLPPELTKKALAASPQARRDYEVILEGYARELFRRRFPDLDEYFSQIDEVLFEAINNAVDNDEKKIALRGEYFDFMLPFLRKLGYRRDRPDPNDPDDVIVDAKREDVP